MKEFHIQWHIASRCNLRCSHCYQDDFSDRGELGWPDLKRVCDNILQAMKKEDLRLTVALTGGEPFLKKELWDLVDYLSNSEYVLNISIITNGTVIDKNISKVRQYPLLEEIYVSLDGTGPETNDNIRGKGAFNKAVENIKILKSYGLSVFIMFTLLKNNIMEAGKLHDFCKSLSLDGYILERFIPLGQGKKIMDELVTPEQLNNLYRTIFNQCGLKYNEADGAKYHALKAESGNLYGAECIVGKDGCAILPDGTVLPCRRFYHPLGNLLKESFVDIWENSEVLNKLNDRNNLKGYCRDCEIKECSGCRALAHAVTGDYLSEDPLCRLLPLYPPR